jgi:hypothetical protein
MTQAFDHEAMIANAKIEWSRPVSEIEAGFIGEASLDMYRFFPYAVDIERLDRAFNRTSQVFREFSSVLLQNNGDGFSVGYVPDLLRVTARKLDENYTWDPSIGFDRYMDSAISVPGQPLYKVTATQLGDGTVVAESLSHVVADGFTRYVFLRHVSAAICDCPVPAPFNSIHSKRYQRSDSRGRRLSTWSQPSEVGSPSCKISAIGKRPGYFYSHRLNHGWISEVRARNSLSSHLTSSDIITGYLLRLWGLSMCPNSTSGFRARVPVDVRSFVDDQDLNLGNAFIDAVVEGTPDRWKGISLEAAAVAVHESILRARSLILQACKGHQRGLALKDQAWFKQLSHRMRNDHPFSNDTDIVISNILKLPYDAIDYGNGPAIDQFSANAAPSSFVLFTLGTDMIMAISSRFPLVVDRRAQ